jgi:hypothetical protein
MDLFNQLISTKIYESKDNTYSEKFPSENFTNFNEPKNYINECEIYNYQSFNLIDSHNYNLQHLFFPEKETNITNYKTNELFKIDNKIPLSYLEDNINTKIIKMNLSKEIKNKLLLDKTLKNIYIENVKNDLVIKKKGRKKNFINTLMNNSNVVRGRKSKGDKTIRKHTKYSSDNITNKIKNILKKFLIIFLNNIINNIYDRTKREKILKLIDNTISKKKSNNLIKDIEHDITFNIKAKKNNLELLDNTIKNFLSHPISGKVSIDLPNFNELVIEELLKDEENKDIFNFIFNKITIGNWLDIFIFQKEFNEDFYDFNSLNNAKKQVIIDNLIRIDNILLSIYENDKIYFYCFLLLIYNYRRFFMLKDGRNRQKK